MLATQTVLWVLVTAVVWSCAGCSDAGDRVAADAAGAVDAGAGADASATDATATDASATDASATDDAAGGDTLVFVTSMKYDGNLGGLVGADAQCQVLADAAALGGTWLAWLGDGTDGPATRFVQSDTAYRRVGGGIVAENWTDLIDGTLGVPIDHDETGTALPPADDMIVWTAVFHTGGNPTPVHCMGWTAADETLVPTGLASKTDTGWTVFAPHNCSEMHRLYCFEQ